MRADAQDPRFAVSGHQEALDPRTRAWLQTLTRRLAERLLSAQKAGESGDLQVQVTFDLQKGVARGVRWRPDERLEADQG